MDNRERHLKIEPRPSSPFPRVVDTLFADVACSVFVIGNDLRPVWSSSPDGRLLGIRTDAWEPGSLISVVHPDDQGWMRRKRHEILSTPGATVRGRVRICPPDHEPSTVLFTASNRFDDPAINGLVITTRPMIEPSPEDEPATSESRARTEALSKLEQSVRTSVSAISEATQKLADQLDPVRGAAVASVAAATTTLRSLLDDVADLATISAGTFDFSPTVFAPSEVIDDITAKFGPMCEAKGLDLRLSIDTAVPSEVRGDADRLTRVLRQLLSNAVRSTDTGHVELEVRVNELGRIRFRVADTGGGLSPAAQTALFGDVASMPHADGGGFGLAIARQFVELMDGKLAYESSDAGSAFWFDVVLEPARRIEDRTAHVAPLSADAGPDDQPPMHVLVVDDSEVNRLLATSQLERLGHTFETATGGAEGLRKLIDHTFDAVLMDWHMPDINGLEATRRWRAEHDPQHELPIITMTASAMTGDRERCLDAGASDYLAKPVSIDDLSAMLARWAGNTDATGAPGSTGSPTRVERSKIDLLIADLGDHTVVQTIVDAFTDMVPQHAAAAASAFETNDRKTIHRSAHTLKSSAQMLGTTGLARACEQLETAIADQCDDIEIEVEAFLRACDHVMSELETLQTELSATSRIVP